MQKIIRQACFAMWVINAVLFCGGVFTDAGASLLMLHASSAALCYIGYRMNS